MANKAKYQAIVLHLVDGRKIVAMMPAFRDDSEYIEIEKISVTEAMESPDDCYWEDVTKGKNEDI